MKPTRNSRKPRKPVLSPTRIGIYLSCPLMYKFVYVDKIGRLFYTPKAGHSFGSSLHRALSDFHESGGPEAQTADQLVGCLRDRWVSLGYNSLTDEREHLEAAAAMLAEYHTAHTAPGERTIFVERQLKCDMGEFTLAGRIDRLAEQSDGTIRVIDYKSGRQSVSVEEVRCDLAMNIYQLLASKNYPDRPIAGTIYCLRTNVEATVRLSHAEIEELEDEVRAIVTDILRIDADSVIEPVQRELCAACDFSRRCERLARLQTDC